MTSICLRRFGLLLCTVLFSQYFLLASIISAGGVPLDKDGDTIPAAEGSIPFVKMPDALAGGPSEYTWDYSGTLEDLSGKRFSFLSSVFSSTAHPVWGFTFFSWAGKTGAFSSTPTAPTGVRTPAVSSRRLPKVWTWCKARLPWRPFIYKPIPSSTFSTRSPIGQRDPRVGQCNPQAPPSRCRPSTRGGLANRATHMF